MMLLTLNWPLDGPGCVGLGHGLITLNGIGITATVSVCTVGLGLVDLTLWPVLFDLCDDSCNWQEDCSKWFAWDDGPGPT